ncbi:MAG: NAD(P)-dependent oxidoreductase [Paludibacteraceae bacterium]|nr:NAD(P)-dependent oxidoreductase [Paludibacteraceae bacterium]
MKRTVFLTGATGTMGFAGMQEILKYPNLYNLRILARPSKKNKELLAPLAESHSSLTIVWGDLTKYEDVLKGVTGSDIVLHVGGMVSPQADYRPKATLRTNVTAAENVTKAVLAQPEDQQPKVVYIGSVAQMGDRREPLHWGRAGDPICVSAYDHYGLTKVMAERIITNSGIKQWVSLRQSGILYPAILKNYDPIMFHVPIRGVLEWATVEDSGRLLERVCRPEVPAEFWKNYYNIGSGNEYRLSNYEFEILLLDAIGCPRPEKIFNANWFTTRNFHGMWYLDGDKLENYLHFRANVPVKEYFAQMAKAKSLPWGIKFAAKTRIAKLFPHCVKAAMWFMANSKEHGTQWWIRHNKEPRIHAYYGSLEAYRAIPDWSHMDLSHPSETPVILDHGYDEQKPMADFTIADMQQAAAFRGGKCVSTKMEKGDWDTPLTWQDADGNTFDATPRLILLGGHWSPNSLPYPYEGQKESPRPWAWDRFAKQSPFFAQLWVPLHEADEDNVYGPEVFAGWEK